MKQINDFITEKLRINKYTNNQNDKELIDSIAKHFGFTKDDKEIMEAIEKWVINNSINQIFYYADRELLDEAENIGMPEKIIKDFNTDDDAILDCINAFFKDYDELYSDEYNFRICANETILAFLGDNGNLYASKKKF